MLSKLAVFALMIEGNLYNTVLYANADETKSGVRSKMSCLGQGDLSAFLVLVLFRDKVKSKVKFLFIAISGIFLGILSGSRGS